MGRSRASSWLVVLTKSLVAYTLIATFVWFGSTSLYALWYEEYTAGGDWAIIVGFALGFAAIPAIPYADKGFAKFTAAFIVGVLFILSMLFVWAIYVYHEPKCVAWKAVEPSFYKGKWYERHECSEYRKR